MHFFQTILGNGLTVVAESNPSAVTTAAGFFVKTGSRDEKPELSGMSHFLEHMMFKGTPNRSACDVNRHFDEIGADYNAATTEETTVYYASVIPEHLPTLMDIMTDIMRPALLDEDFETEKSVILEEIALYEDQPRFRVYDTLMSLYFREHPLGNVILGTPRTVAAMTPDQMRQFFRQQYAPGNIVLAATGKVDVDWLVNTAETLCSRWTGDCRPRNPSPPPTGPFAKQVIRDNRLVREHIGLMSPAPDARDDDRFAAQVLATLLGDETGSRLYYDLVETALADEVSLHHSTMDNAGVFMTFMSTDPRKTSRALDTLRGTLAKFMDEGPTDLQMRAARNKIATGITLKGELPMGRLGDVAGDWIYRNDYMSLPDQINRLLSVTEDEVMDLARRYDLSKAAMLALGPVESI